MKKIVKKFNNVKADINLLHIFTHIFFTKRSHNKYGIKNACVIKEEDNSVDSPLRK